VIRYYNKRHWKVTTGLQPIHKYPDNVRNGYRACKFFEYRSDIRGPYEFIYGLSYDLRYPKNVFRQRRKEAA